MTGSERVHAAVEFKGPDRIPHCHKYVPAAFAAYPQLAELYARFPSDFAGQDGRPPQPNHRHQVGEYVDEWGCTWTILKEGYIGQVTHHPLADLSNLGEYHFPVPPCLDSGPLPNPGRRYVWTGGWTLYERMIDLCGFETLHAELAAGNLDVLTLRDRIVEYNLAGIRQCLKQDPDCLCFSDDWGTQIALTISPQMWREVFLPVYRRQFEPIRQAGKHIFFHSDGYTIDILPDLVKAGVNIFWVDLTVNPLARLHSELGGKVCFLGLTDVQFILNHGTREQVRQHGKDLIAALGGFNGGFIAASEIHPDQPYENIVAILETFRDCGKYPLSLRWDTAKNQAVTTVP